MQSTLTPIPKYWDYSKVYTDDLIPRTPDGQEDEHYTIKWYQEGIDKFGNKRRYPGPGPGVQTSVFDQLTDDEFETLMDRIEKSKRLKAKGMM